MRDHFFSHLKTEGFEYIQNQYVKTSDEYTEVYFATENEGEIRHQMKKPDGTIYEDETITLVF